KKLSRGSKRREKVKRLVFWIQSFFFLMGKGTWLCQRIEKQKPQLIVYKKIPHPIQRNLSFFLFLSVI
ncbi:hypothetical protein, partial [Bacillus cereus group sp. BC58]|uniref:hypothetical protein n=1 Tax=Bacillus cereus group sp. BC58 TaxID=3445286 RepID=UPI003F1E7A35